MKTSEHKLSRKAKILIGIIFGVVLAIPAMVALFSGGMGKEAVAISYEETAAYYIKGKIPYCDLVKMEKAEDQDYYIAEFSCNSMTTYVSVHCSKAGCTSAFEGPLLEPQMIQLQRNKGQ